MPTRKEKEDLARYWNVQRKMKRILPLLTICILMYAVPSYAQFRKNRGQTEEQTPSSTQGELNYANPREYIIGGIDVVGLKVLDKNAIISLTGLKIGDKVKIPRDAIANAIRKL